MTRRIRFRRCRSFGRRVNGGSRAEKTYQTGGEKLEKIKAAISAHHTAGSPKLTAEVRDWLEGLKERRDNLLKACSAGRECHARRQPLQEKIENTEERATGVRAKVDILAEELESLGDTEEVGTDPDERDMEKKLQKQIDAANKAVAAARSKLEAIDRVAQALTGKDRCYPLAPDLLTCVLAEEQLDAVLISLRREYKMAGQELDKQKVILKSAEDKLLEFKKKRVERQVRARRALQLKGELNGQRQLLEILDTGLAEMRRELAGLPEEDLALLEELARAEIAIYEAEKEVARGKEGEDMASRKETLERNAKTLTTDVMDAEPLVKDLGAGCMGAYDEPGSFITLLGGHRGPGP